MEETIEALCQHIDGEALDPGTWSKEQSIEILMSVRDHCSTWITTIQDELG